MGRGVAFPGFVEVYEICDLLCPASPLPDQVDLVRNAGACSCGARGQSDDHLRCGKRILVLHG